MQTAENTIISSLLILVLLFIRGLFGKKVSPAFIYSLWLLAAVPRWNHMKTVMLSYPITWVITSILFVVYYLWYTKKHRIG